MSLLPDTLEAAQQHVQPVLHFERHAAIVPEKPAVLLTDEQIDMLDNFGQLPAGLGELWSHPVTPTVTQQSQAPEDRLGVIREICAHMSRIMDNFTPAQVGKLPPEAKQAISEMKSKMIWFVSRPDKLIAVERAMSS